MKITARKAVDPIIATLLLIAIAVAAGIIVYVYVNSLAGGLTSGGGQQVSEQISMDSYNFPGGASGNPFLTLYLRNTGSSSVTLNGVFYDGVSIGTTVCTTCLYYAGGSGSISAGQAFTLTFTAATLSGTTSPALPSSGTSHLIKVVTADGGTSVVTVITGKNG